MNAKLYESLMAGIDAAIYNELNEAYNNMLFEEFNFKDFFDNAVKKTKIAVNAAKDKAIEMKVDVAYKMAKQFIAAIIDKIKETKGAEAAQKYVNELKAKLDDLIKTNISPKQIIAVSKALALGILAAAAVGTIEKNVYDDMRQKQQDEYFMANQDDFQVENKQDSLYKLKRALPIECFSQYEPYKMEPTKTCARFIYQHETLCLFPYYATNEEKASGKITIGVGHVIFDGKTWILPDCLSKERNAKLKADIIKYRKLIRKSNCENHQNKARANNMPDLLTKEEALQIFHEDLIKTDLKVRQTLGLKKCGNPDYNVFGKINKNVALYCYYNQNIYDALISFTFNAGTLKNSIKFSQRLQNCRYDKQWNIINTDDFAYTFEAFKEGNGRNLERRKAEYNEFKLGKTKQINTSFFDHIKDHIDI